MFLFLLLLVHLASLSLQEDIAWVDASKVVWAVFPSYRAPDGYNCAKTSGNHDCFLNGRAYVTRYHANDGHGVASSWFTDGTYVMLDTGAVVEKLTARAIKDMKLEILNYTNSISWVLATGDDPPLTTLVSSGWLNDGAAVYPCRAFHKRENINKNHLVIGRYVAGPGKKRSGGCIISAPDSVGKYALIKTYEVMQINLFGLTKDRKRQVYTSKDYCPGNLCDPNMMKEKT